MIQLKPEIIHHNGRPKFAVILYADFLALQEEVEDAACLSLLREAKAKEVDAPTVSLSDMKSKLGLKPRQRSRRSTSAS